MKQLSMEWLAEAFYDHLCRIPTTAEQRGQIIHELLSADDAPPHVKSVAVWLAMIHAAEEDHPGRRSLRPSTPPPTNRRLN
jgi:hypothetical protein